uniref:Pentatricopeptide repeat-containing protein At5g25630-like n=1 Tax=Nelumbo nucifera TaxID=4432 RepID=A0A822ZMA9_NELNU|nr:TPA_asm: hypothetical protein HUJ06_002891 [Nelumbo nucifera]
MREFGAKGTDSSMSSKNQNGTFMNKKELVHASNGKVLTLMEEFGVKPDVITFSTIMNAWSAAGLMDRCREIFDDMLKAGIEPDTHAYSILAKGYVRAREPEKAEALLTAMVESDVVPNVVIFTTIISGWCSASKMEYAMRVFEKMCEFGVSPNLKTFDTLIWGYGEAKQPWKAEEMLQTMEEVGVLPEANTIQLVAEAWRAIGLVSEATRVLNTMKEQEVIQTSDTKRDEIPVESLEKIYQRQNLSAYPNVLQIPGVVMNDQHGSAATIRRSRMVLRDTEVSSESLWTATKSMYLMHTCKFGAKAPMRCKKQSLIQLGIHPQNVNSYRVVFLN